MFRERRIAKPLRALLALCGILMLSPAAFAQYTLSYSTNGNVITVYGYGGTPVVVTVPSFVNIIGQGAFQFCTTLANINFGTGVTNIQQSAFYNCSKLTNVTIPNNVTSIGTSAFESCTGLTNVVLSTNLTSIAGETFISCSSLQSINIPDSVTTINSSAFESCTSLSNAIIGSGVTVIGESAFQSCSALSSVTVGNGITSISDDAFYLCTNLTTAFFSGNAPSADATIFSTEVYGGGLDPVTVYFLPGTTGWGTNFADVPTVLLALIYATNNNAITITGYTNSLSTIPIPPAIDGLPVGSIASNAFYGCSNLTNVIVPTSVTNIQGGAFAGCSNLVTITVSGPNPSYSGSNGVVFDGGQDTLIAYPPGANGNYTIPSTVTNVAAYAFYNCYGLTGATVPNSVGSIGAGAFADCPNLGSVSVGTNLASIGENAFAGCSNLTSIYFNGNAPTAATTVFSSDPMTAYYLSGTTGWTSPFAGVPAELFPFTYTTIIAPRSTVTNIQITGYTGGSGSQLAIPSLIVGLPVSSINLLSIPAYQTPNSMSNVTTLTLPNSMAGDVLLGPCTNLTTVIINGNIAGPSDLGAFWECYNLTNIIVGNGVTNIGSYAFTFEPTGVPYAASISISLPPTLTSISEDAFFYCTNLASITIPKNVTNIGYSAFVDCANLNTIYFLGNAPAGSSLFYSTPATVFYFPGTTGWSSSFNGLPTMLFAFTYTTNNGTITLTGYTNSITNFALPNSVNGIPVTGLGPYAFENQSGFSTINIPNTVTNIGPAPFVNCSRLTNITVSSQNPSYVSSNGVLFTLNQTALVEYPNGIPGSYTIPNSVTAILDSAFSFCTGLTNLTIPNSVISIGQGAFQACFDLTQVDIPNSVTSISNSAFGLCTGLRSVIIGNGVTNVAVGAFDFCGDLNNIFFAGNAPSSGGSLFINGPNNDPVTIYYLPGTTGWGTTYSSCPTALWNPWIQTGDGLFGVQTNNRFGFTITGTSNIPITIQACTNLTGTNWTTLQSCNLTNGSIYFTDPAWTNYPGRFYSVAFP